MKKMHTVNFTKKRKKMSKEIREAISKRMKIKNPMFNSAIAKKVGRMRKGKKMSKETIKRMSESKVGNVPWNKGLTKKTDLRIELVGKKIQKKLKGRTPWNKGLTKAKHLSLQKISKKTSERNKKFWSNKSWKEKRLEGLRKVSNPSKFQLSVGKALKRSGYKLKSEFQIGEKFFDFKILGTNLLIEADGIYWHSKEKAVRNDRYKEKLANSNGYKLLRIKDKEFYKSGEEEFIASVKKQLENKNNLETGEFK